MFLMRQNILKNSIALGAYAASDAKNALVNQTENLLLSLTYNKSMLLDEHLAIIKNNIEQMSYAATSALQASNNRIGALNAITESVLAAIQGIANEEAQMVFYYGTENGEFFVPSNFKGALPPAGWDPRTRPWYRHAIEENTLIWTDLYEDTNGRGFAVSCAKPFYESSGAAAGVAGTGIMINELNDIVDSTQAGESGLAFMLDRNGRVIITEHKTNGRESADRTGIKLHANLLEERGNQLHEIAQRMVQGGYGVESIKINGVDFFIAYNQLKASGWCFAIAVETGEVISHALEIERDIINSTLTVILKGDRDVIVLAIIVLLTLILAVFSVIFLSENLASYITKPIQKLSDDAALIGSGSLDHILEVDTGDELEQLCGSFNAMLVNVREITSEKERITAAKELAEQNSRYKSAFLANMSHEIRTPMNAILGIAEIQLHDDTLSYTARDAFAKIYESGDLLLNIINDILDLSRIESGKLSLSPVNYDIPSLVNDTAQLNRLRYESKPIAFSISVNKDTPHNLYGDEIRIKQILNNILSNAFKYTDEGQIEFFVTFEKGETPDNIILIFRISDTGQGMTEEQLDKLFEEYSRFNAEANRSTTGAGLGMTITKRLIDMMNGNIFIKSKPGAGSVFTVHIPQKRIGSAVCGAELAEKLRNFRFQSTALSKKTQFLREYMPYGNVLVVDDVESNLYVIKGMLLPYGLRIETACNGLEAVEKIQNGKTFDVIFMDHMMPKMDGMEAVKIIRGMGYDKTIVALTANALVGRAQMFIDNGFDAFVSKPIDSRELNYMLNEYIRNKKPHDVVQDARRMQIEREKILVSGDNVMSQKIIKTYEVKKFFIRDAQNAINILENLDMSDLDNSQLKSFIITIHGMKSALANIDEGALSAAALKLENAGKDRNLNLLSNETPVFLDALKSIIAKFKPAEDFSGVKASDDDMFYLREKMRIIKDECLVLNKPAVKSAMNDLRGRTWPLDIGNVLDDIAVSLLHSDFKKAAELAGSFTA